MNIAITGHANGIGKGLFKFYADNNCIGFDLSNGYNINTDIDKILEESKHCEIFVNNAYSKNKQTELAEAWHKLHANDDFLLINISSTFVDLTIAAQLEIQSPCLMEYIKYKKKLNQASQLINLTNNKCKSISVIIGLVDTQFIDSWYNWFTQHELEYFTKVIADCNLIEIAEVVNLVDFAVQSNKAHNFISSISLSNKIG